MHTNVTVVHSLYCVQCNLLVDFFEAWLPTGSKVCFDEERDHGHVEHFFKNQNILHTRHTNQTVYDQSMSIQYNRSF